MLRAVPDAFRAAAESGQSVQSLKELNQING